MHGSNPVETCDVCGRTILRGEGTRAYVTPEGDHRTVCDLCRERAEAAGWIRADSPEAQRPAAPADRRRGGIGAWPRSRREGQGRQNAAPGQAEEDAAPEQAEEPPPDDPDEQRGEVVAPPPETEPEDAAAPERPAPARPREPRRVHAVPTDRVARMEAAMARFNRSEHARTVAGLIRTLGRPQVSAGARAGKPAEVLLTVAWELSWYQWSVDLADDEADVRPVAKGREVGELEEPARQWNAHADEDGALRPGIAESGG